MIPIKPTLYLVSNSLGDDKDLPPRTKELLESANIVLGEEQRTTSTLLKRLGIAREFEVVNEHSSEEEIDEILLRLLQVPLSCIISDSGSPGLEDPAKKIVPKAWDYGISVMAAPGPTAAMAALTASGFQSSPFTFIGFFPKDQKERERDLKAYLNLGHTLVFYETPYRTKHMLESLSKVVPANRRVFLNLDISLKFEKSYRGTAKELHKIVQTNSKAMPVFVIEEKNSRQTR
jgi:16S rRNA (cytidine1402-2'-O)-methyltransferase